MFSSQKCGVSFDPPTIVVYYLVKLTGKLHRRSIPVRKFTADSSISETAQALKDSFNHRNYLEDVQTKQLEKLLKMIQDHMNGKDPSRHVPAPSGGTGKDPLRHVPAPSDGTIVHQDEDLNKLDDYELDKRKAIMDEEFEKHRIKPGESNFEYDKEVEFDVGKLESGWDEDEYSDPEF